MVCVVSLASFSHVAVVLWQTVMHVIVLCLTQVNGTPVVAEEESFVQKAKISIVINEDRYGSNFLVHTRR